MPCSFDYYNYRGHRPPGRLYHWVLVSARPQELAAWAAKTGVAGSLQLAAPDRAVFLLAQNPSAPAAQEQLLDRFQGSCTLMD